MIRSNITLEQIEQAKSLRIQGNSYRAIGDIIGVKEWTVRYWVELKEREKASIRYQERYRGKRHENYKNRSFADICKKALQTAASYAKKCGHAKCNAIVEQLVIAYQNQNGCCALCGRDESMGRLHMDHDHKTGNFRGWLCFRCNRDLSTVEKVGLDKIEKFLNTGITGMDATENTTK